MAQPSPFDIVPSFPQPPRGKAVTSEALAKWAEDMVRSSADAFRRFRETTQAFATKITAAAGVSSLATNANPPVAGAISFGDTASIAWANAGTAFSATLAAIPGTVPPPSAWLVTPAFLWGTAFAAGSGTNLVRSNATLVYPEAIATAADRTKRGILTDDATFGALLDFSAGTAFTVNSVAIKSPGGTLPLGIGTIGNINCGGVPDPNVVMKFSGTISSSSAISAITASLVQSGTGGMSPGVFISLTNSGTSTADHVGFRLLPKQNNASASGNLTGFEVNPASNAYTGTRAKVYCYATMGGSTLLASGTITDLGHFVARQTTLITSTLTNNYAFLQDASFTKGTNRWGFKVFNKGEINASDLVFGTAGKGTVTPDTQGTPEFWRIYPSATGLKDATITVDALGFVSATRAAAASGAVTLNIQDTGTVAPAT